MYKSDVTEKQNMTICHLTDGWVDVSILTLGARLINVAFPDKNGHKENIVLSYDDLTRYKNDGYCFGATVGPVAGRIQNGKWQDYQLELNEGDNTLHCGANGWQNREFDIVSHHASSDYAEVVLTPKKAEVGLPEDDTTVTYRLTDHHALQVIYHTTAKRETIWNPTNHAYFNLSGKAQSIRDHELYVNSHYRLETRDDNIPTGELIETKNSAYDFSTLSSLEKMPSCGFDDCFILEKDSQNNKEALVLKHQASGRKMNIITNRDSIILFSGTGMTDDHISIRQQPLISEEGLAIECQETPDAIHHQLSNIIVKEHDEKTVMTTYQFELESH